MACDYHNRIDFRALDVIVEAIVNATPSELDAAIKTCEEMASGAGYDHGAMKRTIWRAFAAMLRLYRRKYA